MRTFFENWNSIFSNRPSTTDKNTSSLIPENITITIRPLTTDELNISDLESFTSIGFTHHYEILLKTSDIEERLFYIRHCATEFWSVEKLRYYLNEKSYFKQAVANNFNQTITNVNEPYNHSKMNISLILSTSRTLMRLMNELLKTRSFKT